MYDRWTRLTAADKRRIFDEVQSLAEIAIRGYAVNDAHTLRLMLSAKLDEMLREYGL